ncbi:MAG: ATP/GTP-binding protein, partial [Candidatus Nezhaarchaeales archaeon]
MVFLGTAGCGKSLLTHSFGEWIKSNLNLDVGYVNLDPGCEYTPYEPDFDIRSIFTISDLMMKEGLGPNGAMIRASQLMEERFQEIAKAIVSINAKSAYTLIDTPGQMEIFVFRPTGPLVISRLRSLS